MDGTRFVCPGFQFGLIPHEPLVVQKQTILYSNIVICVPFISYFRLLVFGT